MIHCQICGKELTLKGLANHVICHNLTSEKYYELYLKTPNEGNCRTCDAITKFINIREGYRKFCSTRCSTLNINVQKKRKNTCNKKYGVDSPAKDERVKIKMIENSKKVCMEKYGVSNYLSSNEFKEKYRRYIFSGRVNKISKPQRKLFKLVKNLFIDAELEVPCLNFSMDIAIPSEMLSIEYDGSYWHQGREDYDNRRQKLIENEGWKVIRFRDYIPSHNELIQKIIDVI